MFVIMSALLHFSFFLLLLLLLLHLLFFFLFLFLQSLDALDKTQLSRKKKKNK